VSSPAGPRRRLSSSSGLSSEFPVLGLGGCRRAGSVGGALFFSALLKWRMLDDRSTAVTIRTPPSYRGTAVSVVAETASRITRVELDADGRTLG